MTRSRNIVVAAIVAASLAADARAQGERGAVLRFKSADEIISAAFDDASKRLAVLQGDHVHVYALPTFKLACRVPRPNGWMSLALSPQGDYIAVNGRTRGTIDVWDVSTAAPRIVKRLVPVDGPPRDDEGAASTISFTADGKRVAAVQVGLKKCGLSFWDWKESARPAQFIDASDLGFTHAEGEKLYEENSNDRAASRRLRFGRVANGGTVVLDRVITAPYTELGKAPPFSVSRDFKTAVVWNETNRAVELIDLASEKMPVVDKVRYSQLSKDGALSLHVVGVDASPDRSILFVVYREYDKGSLCVAMFPRTKERFRQFGLDAATHSHLMMWGIFGEAPRPVFSPDGRWFVFLDAPVLDPILWRTDALAATLARVENITVEKR